MRGCINLGKILLHFQLFTLARRELSKLFGLLGVNWKNFLIVFLCLVGLLGRGLKSLAATELKYFMRLKVGKVKTMYLKSCACVSSKQKQLTTVKEAKRRRNRKWLLNAQTYANKQTHEGKEVINTVPQNKETFNTLQRLCRLNGMTNWLLATQIALLSASAMAACWRILPTDWCCCDFRHHLLLTHEIRVNTMFSASLSRQLWIWGQLNLTQWHRMAAVEKNPKRRLTYTHT